LTTGRASNAAATSTVPLKSVVIRRRIVRAS
jgi:hypothetical protein